jgi:hypothetical protein
MNEAFSIRQSLQGALLDFLQQSDFSCVHTADMVRELVCLLAAYREEDVPLFPDVFVIGARDDTNLLAPGIPRIRLGECTLGDSAAGKLLKDCAYLAAGGWAIYVAKIAERTAEYGLIRSQRHSFATTSEEVLRGTDDMPPILLVRNRGHMVVQLTNAKGEEYTVSLTPSPASPSPLVANVARFAKYASASVADEDFLPYLTRLLTGIIQRELS